ncbi:MAG: sulfatase, partial [Deltaproteobacteria bacterium]|nr:sulfatase [Deltaproteobacteria bacterium]
MSRLLMMAWIFAWLSSTLGCGPSGEPGSKSAPPLRYFDLLRRAPQGQRAIRVVAAEGDYRPALVTGGTSTTPLASVVVGADCRMRVGLYLEAAPESREATAVEFRVWRLGEDGRSALFQEILEIDPVNAPTWHDRSFALDRHEAELVELELESKPLAREGSGVSFVAWGSPHLACAGPAPVADLAASDGQAARPNVVLISIDTLRQDRLGLYGHCRDTSPVLDEFAEEAVIFDQAFTVAPSTLPAHASLMTGLYPEEHGAGDTSGRDPLPDHVPTLAERLRAEGYRTIAHTAGGIMGAKSGLGQGFEIYRAHTRASLRSLLPSIFEDLANAVSQAPTFLFVHTYDVHGPYIQPRAERVFEPSDCDVRIGPVEWARIGAIEYHDHQLFGRFSDLDEVTAAYDSGVHYVDAEIGELFAYLRSVDLFENALIIVTSDHGEALYDRGVYVGHTYTLHDPLLRVPMLVRLPGARQRGRVDELVDSVDLMPLILDEIGLDTLSPQSGSNPLARMRGELPSRTFVRGEARHSGSLYARSHRFKVISGGHPPGDSRAAVPPRLLDRHQSGAQWYRLENDPGERQNLVWAADSDIPELQ